MQGVTGHGNLRKKAELCEKKRKLERWMIAQK
jgi:hypothetical protein